jgi:hypothetical protein
MFHILVFLAVCDTAYLMWRGQWLVVACGVLLSLGHMSFLVWRDGRR